MSSERSVPRKFWVALAISAALNMFCLGLFVARATWYRPEARGDEMSARAFLRHSGLREAGPEVQAILKGQRGHMRDTMRSLAEVRREAQEALRAEPYDAARVRAALAQVRERTSAMQADMHEVLADIASKLSPGQRKRMASALWHGREGRGPTRPF